MKKFWIGFAIVLVFAILTATVVCGVMSAIHNVSFWHELLSWLEKMHIVKKSAETAMITFIK